MRGDESLADDLIVRMGRVRGRVALLLRSTERKPSPTRFFPDAPRCISHRTVRYTRTFEGGLWTRLLPSASKDGTVIRREWLRLLPGWIVRWWFHLRVTLWNAQRGNLPRLVRCWFHLRVILAEWISVSDRRAICF
jgi:hypothetical protein